MIKKYRVVLEPWLDIGFCAEWEIDFSFKNFNKTVARPINDVEQAIREMNGFWSGSPYDNDPFKEHLEYWLKSATLAIHHIYNNTVLWKPESLTKHLFTNEDGFAIGECGIKLVAYTDEFELAEHMLKIEEV
ncbi:MAG: hypothetical protein SPE78_03425 [Actinobacillus minor]|nr:hypothetical protein [Actinobacillus minor]